MRNRWIALYVGLAALLSGCGGGRPYVATDYRVHQRGLVLVCFDPALTTIDQAKTLADTVCKEYDRVAKYFLEQKDQCSWRAPTQVTFTCVARPGENPPPFTDRRNPMRHEPALPPP